ncbi:MAG: hypothetical protein WC898_02260 [Candidatus Paceibacterota bacterium]|jgi:hypothetical protein
MDLTINIPIVVPESEVMMIENIVIQDRVPKDTANINTLAKCLQKIGQLSDVPISKSGVLLGDWRTVEAAKMAGQTTIRVIRHAVYTEDEIRSIQDTLAKYPPNIDIKDYLELCLKDITKKTK